MDDRTLLELAAKAIGIQIDDWNGDYPVIYIEHWSGSENDAPDREVTYWNPLTDDGDALRLAVKLGFVVSFSPREDCRGQTVVSRGDLLAAEPCYEGREAAARRAIVLAAAEIGKSPVSAPGAVEGGTAR